jgi:hypothetical protein
MSLETRLRAIGLGWATRFALLGIRSVIILGPINVIAVYKVGPCCKTGQHHRRDDGAGPEGAPPRPNRVEGGDLGKPGTLAVSSR